MAVISYLLRSRETPLRYGLDHAFSVDSPDFVETLAGTTGVPLLGDSGAAILNNGDAFYPAMLEAIAEARESVTIEAYIYWAGEVGRKFALALAEKASSGVPVKILLDAVGSATIGKDILRILDLGGCQVAWYNPIRWYSIGRFNYRTHRKSLIIDGRVGFTGGAGIADHWVGNAQDHEHWRDIQIRLEGPAVTPLQTGFAQNWLESTGELLSDPRYFSSGGSKGRLRMQTIMSSPETGASTVRIMYFLSIVCARKSIYIATPYFVPDPVALDTLIDAKKRGVDVRIMVTGIWSDNWLARQNGVRLYGRLLRAGIQILEFNRTMLHQKTMVVDGVWSTIGTTNFDSRSFALNEETNVCIYDADVGEELRRIFMEDTTGCEQIRYETWRHRGTWAKSKEFLASFLEEQT